MSSSDPAQLVEAALLALNRQDLETAGRLIDSLAGLDAPLMHLNLCRASLLTAQGRYPEALAALRCELTHFPANTAAQGLFEALNGMLFKVSPPQQGEPSIPVPEYDPSLNRWPAIASRAEQHWPRITIVTPSFNQRDLLEACIHSILSQGYPNLEYIIIDGGSSDGSIDVIRKHQARLAFWRSCPDAGPYAAVQEGFMRSTGEVMGWLNSDDLLCPNGLFVLGEIFRAMPHIEFLSGRRTVFDARGIPSDAEYPLLRVSREEYIYEENLTDPPIYLMQEGTYWRRSLWQRCGATLDLSLRLAADFELWARFLRVAPLYTTAGHIGGFRSHSSEQRSQKFRAEYRRESAVVLHRERALSIPDRDFHHRAPAVVEYPLQPYPTMRQATSDTPRISVVVQALQEGEYLEECLASILTQEWPATDLRVAAPAASRRTLQRLAQYRQYLAEDPIVMGSLTETTEAALVRSSGDILCCINTNCKFHPDSFAVAANIFARWPSVEWISGRTFAWNAQGDLSWISTSPSVYCRRNFVRGNYREPHLQPESVFWRRSLWQRAGGRLDTGLEYAADLELWLRFSRTAELYTVNYPLGGHHHPVEGLWDLEPYRYRREAVRLIEREARIPSPFQDTAPPMPIFSLKQQAQG